MMLSYFFVQAILINPNRTFPDSFKFCTATAAYQIEGAVHEDGRSPSIWDTFSHTPGRTDGGQTGDNAIDHYHLFRDDIDLMKEMGIDVYRMSLSPSRFLPTIDLVPNQAAIDHYRRELEYLRDAGITPLVTLYHWDLPQYVEDAYGGWLNSSAMVWFFTRYSDVVFEALGDLVTKWSSFNEPYTYCMQGYQFGSMAPGRSINPATEPYDCIHSVLLAHASIYKVYQDKYKAKYNGTISLVCNCDWQEPFSDSPQDAAAAERALDYYLHVFTDPIYFGHYPYSLINNSEGRLKQLTSEESALIKGSADVFTLNSYTSSYVQDDPNMPLGVSYDNDGQLSKSNINWNGTIIGGDAEPDWLKIVPWGLGKLLRHIEDRYHPGEILVTENGLCVKGEPQLSYPDVLHDQGRIDFYKGYLGSVLDAIHDGVPVTTYCAWSMLDNYEWARGYTQRFGITYVDYETQIRYLKDSAKWYAGVINRSEEV